jgi:hypothetical protein
MTGYEQSPDYGDPPHWRADLLLALTIAMVLGAIVLTFLW